MDAPSRGMTLIELLVTLAILLAIVAWGVPHLGAAVKQTRITTGVNTLVSALETARSLAVTRGRTATLCAQDADAADSCDPLGNWASGMILFVDQVGDGVINDTDKIRRRWDDAATGLEIQADSRAVTYRPDGSVTAAVWHFCDASGTLAPRAVRVMESGAHMNFSPSSCGAGL